MTYHPKSEFLHELSTRGFIADCTNLQELDEKLISGVVTGYIGFDLTATSLHIGNLVQIMLLRWLQKTGHRPITLMGGGTTKVGDPSGKDEMRKILTVAQINENAGGIRKVFSRYISYGDGPLDSPLVNNAEWLDQLKYIDFLRDIGQHFTINRLLAFESVKSRLDREQPLSFIEFNYMLLQSYDFLELNRRFGCSLQMGGSDQWGNIVSGADLIRRVDQADAYGLTTPLVTRADGKKMGKSAEGAVWLNEDMMSPYDFWQWWRNVADPDVGRFLKLFTDLPVAECDRLGALAGSEINAAKIRLANEVTTLLHGAEAAQAAEATARDVFEKGGIGEDLPTVTLSLNDFSEETPLDSDPSDPNTPRTRRIAAHSLFLRAGLVKSGKEAKRLFAEQGARINDTVITDITTQFEPNDFAEPLKLSAGKKRHALVQLS
ncbi:tyrosine--tRNA ligase [Roseobacter weihaiensis]|uniref:tyrosine--tRNA ligase n=1 Tax=Roseobacter weihaiensis TaxID=2763262 RepID=UPI001D0AE645|nr:tyrosine--tRNA ligase [Roseobacter sp. H9]